MVDEPTFYSISRTAAADSPFRVCEDIRVILSSCNVYCYTNDMKMQDMGGEYSIIRANAVVWYDGVIRPFDFFFMNNAAGSNGKIVIQGIRKR